MFYLSIIILSESLSLQNIITFPLKIVIYVWINKIRVFQFFNFLFLFLRDRDVHIITFDDKNS